MNDEWVLVPRKLTVGMIAAGWAAFRRDKPPVQLLGPGKGFCEAWEAMLEASAVTSAQSGCGDPNCKDPNCTYGSK